eukprot:4511836-Pleurochrysis_carterae.AAC.1
MLVQLWRVAVVVSAGVDLAWVRLAQPVGALARVEAPQGAAPASRRPVAPAAEVEDALPCLPRFGAAARLGVRLRPVVRLVVPRPRRRHRHVRVRLVAVVRKDGQRLAARHLWVVPQVRDELYVRQPHEPRDGAQHVGEQLHPVVRIGADERAAALNGDVRARRGVGALPRVELFAEGQVKCSSADAARGPAREALIDQWRPDGAVVLPIRRRATSAEQWAATAVTRRHGCG